ncbi:MAG TPA: hypothetical protein VN673_02415 [Clostridia bacterium]|nr:hypothetical protein [Clostridia bacterium]
METTTSKIVLAPVELTRLVSRAAKEVRLIRAAGTDYPWIVVRGVIESGRLRLEVVEGGYPATGQNLAGPNEIIAFEREGPPPRQGGDMFRPNTPRTLFERMSKAEIFDFLVANPKTTSNEFDRKIHSAVCGWLLSHGAEVQDVPRELRYFIQEERVPEAISLGHVYLHHLAHDPIRKAREIFDVCDLMQSSKNASLYQSTVLGVLQALSKNIHALKNFYGSAGEKRLTKVIEIDLELYRRSKSDQSQSFRHRPRPESTAHLL